MDLIRQRAWPMTKMPFAVIPNLARYNRPNLTPPDPEKDRPLVTVLGTVRDELPALQRSWAVWSQQRIPASWLVEYVVLDEGSRDGVGRWVAERQREGAPITRIVTARPGGPQRSCTLAMNACIRHHVRSPLIMIQWWDRIPGSFDHLRALVAPHLTRTNCATSAVARHIGASSSVEDFDSTTLNRALAQVAWQEDPLKLAKIAGEIGPHCLPGAQTESAGLVIRREHFAAIGGFDERYTTRASYVNVELWRRLLHAGIECFNVAEPDGANYHQTHAAPGGRTKSYGFLDDRCIVRNPDGWGNERAVWEVYPCALP